MGRRHRSRGQSATEYMMVISVIVIAVVGAAYVFVAPFREGVEDLGRDVSQILAVGDIGGVGRGGTNSGLSNGGSSGLDPGSQAAGGGSFGNGAAADPSSPSMAPGDAGFANGGFSGMSGNPRGLGQPMDSSTNTAPAPNDGTANGGPGAAPP